MYDIFDKKILKILSYGKHLKAMQYKLNNYTPGRIDDVYITMDVFAHISYIKYLISECWGTYLNYLENQDDHDVANDCFYYRLLSDGEKIIESEFNKAIEECRKLW